MTYTLLLLVTLGHCCSHDQFFCGLFVSWISFLTRNLISYEKCYRTCNVKSARTRKLLLIALGLHWVSHQDWWQGCSVSSGNDTSTLELQVQYVPLPKQQCYIFWFFFNTKKNSKLDVFLSILIGLAPRGLHANSIAFVPSVPRFPDLSMSCLPK